MASELGSGLRPPAAATGKVFVVTGPAFAGAATFARLLARHPDLHIGPEDLDAGESPDAAELRPLPAPAAEESGERRFGCLRPEYLYRPEALAAQADRVLIVLRSPVARARAHHLQERRRGREERDFRTATREDPAASAADRDRTRRYIDPGFYHEPVQRLVDRLGRGRTLVVLFEELLEEPEEVLDRAARFLGVEQERIDLRRWPRIAGETPSARRPSPLLRLLGPSRRREEARARLRDLYAPDIDALERYLCRDLELLRGRG